jgi:arylsulfatase A-like enzyme
VLPTVLDALGLPAPDGLPGRSLARLAVDGAPHAAEAGAAEDRVVVAESFPTGAQARFHRMERALYAGDHKLIVNTEGKRELYDLAADPAEETNLYAVSDSLADGMQARMDAWLAETVERSDSTAAAALDDDMRERLSGAAPRSCARPAAARAPRLRRARSPLAARSGRLC